MNGLDYLVICVYLAGMLGIGFVVRQQESENSFFLGGRSLGWFPLALSTMATQLSAISFISAPAFVGLREGGGLKWLTYEFAVPLAMVFVMFVIAPALYRANVVSIYDYLERRFGRSTRLLISFCFQVVRSFSTGIMIYAPALILRAVLGIPIWQSILAVGSIALIYSSVGGMKAVVYSDAIQMVLIFGGLVLVGLYAWDELGGVAGLRQHVDSSRWLAVDFSSTGLHGDEFGFVPMVMGGFVLYASYYGCDQTQAQRFLSATDMKAARRLLLTNGLLRFPLVFLYCLVGLVVGAAIMQSPDSLAKIPAGRSDFMMPIFIVDNLPHGVIGLLVVAILSAAMSSVSSGMNSLAAVTLEDLRTLGFRSSSADRELSVARGLSVAWGVIIILLSFFAGSIAPTVIEAINKVGSALYGPILGIFVLAIVSSRRSAFAANVGLLVGLGVNLSLWIFAPGVFWMWWNFIGLVLTVAIASALTAVVSNASQRDVPAAEVPETDKITGAGNMRIAFVLTAFFLVIVTFSILASAWGVSFTRCRPITRRRSARPKRCLGPQPGGSDGEARRSSSAARRRVSRGGRRSHGAGQAHAEPPGLSAPGPHDRGGRRKSGRADGGGRRYGADGRRHRVGSHSGGTRTVVAVAADRHDARRPSCARRSVTCGGEPNLGVGKVCRSR